MKNKYYNPNKNQFEIERLENIESGPTKLPNKGAMPDDDLISYEEIERGKEK